MPPSKKYSIPENGISIDQFENGKIAPIILLITFLVVDMLKNIALIVASSLIISKEPSYYNDSWEPKAAAIAVVVSSCISELTEIMFFMLLPFIMENKGSGGTLGKGGSTLIFFAQVFAMVCVYISWNKIWVDDIGKMFCIMVGIVTPSLMLIYIIVTTVVMCCIVSCEE